MGKSAGPPQKLEMPKTQPCGYCQGKGFLNQMLYEMPCAMCGGVGKVHAETGEKLELDVVIIMLRRELYQQKATNKRQAEELAELYSKLPDETDRYGELKKMHGGLYRGD